MNKLFTAGLTTMRIPCGSDPAITIKDKTHMKMDRRRFMQTGLLSVPILFAANAAIGNPLDEVRKRLPHHDTAYPDKNGTIWLPIWNGEGARCTNNFTKQPWETQGNYGKRARFEVVGVRDSEINDLKFQVYEDKPLREDKARGTDLERRVEGPIVHHGSVIFLYNGYDGVGYYLNWRADQWRHDRFKQFMKLNPNATVKVTVLSNA
jgi:hypothetical protein